MESITATSNTQTAAANPAKSQAQEQKNQFLQLLVAQLKGQNPLNPMEGSEFVAQLAQFSSLEELIKIRGSLDNVQQLLAKPETKQGNNPFASPTAEKE